MRKVANTASSSVLRGLLFDDAGNAMSPSHSNKKGVRYRYYVSQALLQDRPKEAGSVTRVSAPDVEQLVLEALQNAGRVDALKASEASVREQVARVVVEGKRLIVTLHPRGEINDMSDVSITELTIPFSPRLALRKGLAHAPANREPVLDPQSREALLRAIARARRWHDAMLEGEKSLDEIASAEGLAERYVRRLATLAFLSPKIIGAIADGSAPASLTPSSLSEALPLSWT